MVFEVVSYKAPLIAPAVPPLESEEEGRLDQPAVRILLGEGEAARDEGLGRLIVTTRCALRRQQHCRIQPRRAGPGESLRIFLFSLLFR